MKQFIYILAFAFLGFLAQLFVHAGVEIIYIGLLESNFETFGLGLSWDAWFLVHHIGAIVLFVIGIGIGYWQGFYWWRRLYEKNIRNR